MAAAAGEERTEGGEMTRSGEPELSEELYQAAICMPERIRALQYAGWIGNKGESMQTQSKIGDEDGEMESETGGDSSTGRSSGESLHHAAAVETQGTTTGDSDEISVFCREEAVHRWVSDIMPEFEAKVGDIASVLEAEQTRKEAVAALRFGFRLHLFSEQIDELRHEMCKLLRSFSPENKDIRSTMLKFISEPYLGRICKLQWISERISMLQRMDAHFDSKVKSTIIKLKSESFLLAMEELKEEESGREGVAGEGRGDQEVSMEMEEKRFASYRRCWERIWGNDRSFEDRSE